MSEIVLMADPLGTERRKLKAENQRLRADLSTASELVVYLKGLIEAALALHVRRDEHGYCTECNDPTHWECDTVKALKYPHDEIDEALRGDDDEA